MRIAALVVVLVLLVATVPALVEARRATIEPQTSTIRIRLKGPTLRVRCRGGDCNVTVARDGALIAVSITRTRNGVPFTFARTVQGPTNIAIETGLGNDTVSVGDVSVPGFFRVGTGDGDDVLDVSGTSCAKKAAVDTGGGDDVVHFAPGTIGGKFRLASHAGNDEIDVTAGQFLSKAGFNGGPGTDTFALSGATFPDAPVVTAFEQ